MLGGKWAYLRVGFVSRGPIGGEIWYPNASTSTETELGAVIFNIYRRTAHQGVTYYKKP